MKEPRIKKFYFITLIFFFTKNPFFLQIFPSSPIQINYSVTDHPGIRQWLKQFVSAKRLTGLVSFDFIVDKNTDEAFCIECNPRLHSAIVSFNSKSQVC